mgnify:CR=1 FL=1
MEKNNLAPVALFVFNRLDHTIKTVESLKSNILASKTDLFIFSDGSRNSEDEKEVSEVRKYIKEITGFKSIKIIRNKVNKGLANSIINGVTDVIKLNSKIIVLEDDMVVSSIFLDFMNTALEKYRLNGRVWHVSGWNYPLSIKTAENLFFWDTMNCWGWGTWEDRWEHFNKNPEKLLNNWNSEKIHSFDLNNSGVFWQQVEDNYSGKINTWAIFWYATIFENKGLCLNPCNSLVQNIGLDGSGTNCGVNDSELKLDQQSLNNFIFPEKPDKSEIATNEIINYYKKRNSFYSKVRRKLKYLFD